MTELLAALRTLVYMTGFVLGWGWLALQARPMGRDWVLPEGSSFVGTALMIAGGSCNPMYLGALLVLDEEPTLQRRFGPPYVAYVARVNRWIPKPPRGDRGQSEED